MKKSNLYALFIFIFNVFVLASNGSKSEQLVDAIIQNKSLKEIGELINEKNVNQALKGGATPLHFAVSYYSSDPEKYKKIIKLLIDRGVNIDKKDKLGDSPVKLAVDKLGKKDLAKFILKYFAKKIGLNRNRDGSIKDLVENLFKAISKKSISLVEYILTNNPNLLDKSYNGLKSIHQAAKSGNLEIVKLIFNELALKFKGKLAKKLDEASRQPLGGGGYYFGSPLHFAAMNISDKDFGIFKYLVEKGSDISLTEKGEGLSILRNPINRVCRKIFFKIEDAIDKKQELDRFKKFLKFVHKKSKKKLLKDALSSKQMECQDSLFRSYYCTSREYFNKIEGINKSEKRKILALLNPDKIKIEQKRKTKKIAKKKQKKIVVSSKNLFKFIEDKNLNLVNYILDKNPSLLNKIYNNLKPVHQAAVLGNLEILKFLVSKGANINTKDSMGATPLHYASSAGDTSIIDFLVSKDSDLEAQDSVGATPLHYAVDKGENEVVEFLFSKGANVNARDKNKKTPLHRAAKIGDLKMCKLLIKQGANPIAEDINNMVPASYVGDAIEVRAYLEKELAKKLGIKTLFGEILDYEKNFYKAIKARSVGVVKVLLERLPLLIDKSYKGLKPLHWAAKEGNLRIVKEIITSLKFCIKKKKLKSTWIEYLNAFSKNKFGWRMTPLHYAAKNDINIFEYLVQEGGKIELTAKKLLSKKIGATPIEMFIKNVDRWLIGNDKKRNNSYAKKLVQVLDLINKKYKNKQDVINKLKPTLYKLTKEKSKKWNIDQHLINKILQNLKKVEEIEEI